MPTSVSRKSSKANEVSISSEIAEQSIPSASSDNAEQFLLAASSLRAGQPRSAVLIVRQDQNRQVHSTEPQVENEFLIDANIPGIDRPLRFEGNSFNVM